MNNSPFFSIITITLNSEKYLAETIESVICQDYPKKEHIIIDGGSTDGTLDIIRNYEKHIRWISERDEGISDAMNKGIRMAQGDIISHLHSDDIYKEDTLNKVASAFLNHPNSKWLIGNGEYIDKVGKKIRTTKIENYSFKRLKKHNYLFHPSIFEKKDVFDQVGCFDNKLKLAMDYDMWLRIGYYYKPIFLKDILSSFRVHDCSLSSVEAINALDEEYQIRLKNYDQESLVKKCLYYARYCAARIAKKYNLM